MNKILLSGVVGVLIFFALPNQTLAVSGTCSDHGGINCSIGPTSDGGVVCNDGWTGSSEIYFEADECIGVPISKCTYPIASCSQAQLTSIQAQMGLAEEQMASNGIEETAPSQAQGIISSYQQQIQACQQGINAYATAVQSYNACIVQEKQDLANAAQQALVTLCTTHDINSNYDTNQKKCTCNAGYELNSKDGLCELPAVLCANLYGHAHAESNGSCSCNDGYTASSGACIAIPQSTTPVPQATYQPTPTQATIPTSPPAIIAPTAPVVSKLLPIKQVVKNPVDHTLQVAPVVIYTNATSSNAAVATSTAKVAIKRNFLDSIYHFIGSFFSFF
jgi:hypothetical protein